MLRNSNYVVPTQKPHWQRFSWGFYSLCLQAGTEAPTIQKYVAGDGMFRQARGSVCARGVQLLLPISALTFIVCTVMADAGETNIKSNYFPELSDFVRSIDARRTPSVDIKQISDGLAREKSTDAAYAALRALNDRIGSEQSASAPIPLKLAEADSLFDALREWSQKGSNSATVPSCPVIQRSGGRGDKTKHHRRGDRCRFKSLCDLPFGSNRTLQPHTHG